MGDQQDKKPNKETASNVNSESKCESSDDEIIRRKHSGRQSRRGLDSSSDEDERNEASHEKKSPAIHSVEETNPTSRNSSNSRVENSSVNASEVDERKVEPLIIK